MPRVWDRTTCTITSQKKCYQLAVVNLVRIVSTTECCSQSFYNASFVVAFDPWKFGLNQLIFANSFVSNINGIDNQPLCYAFYNHQNINLVHNETKKIH
jgi:hypothetical protein